MRTQLLVSLIGLLLSFLALARVPTFFEARGFIAGKCYRHPAVRRCSKASCRLEVFPADRGMIQLELVAADRLKPGKETTDYGIFTFQITGVTSGLVPIAHVLETERVPLDRWDSVQEPKLLAHPVACP